ncbi:hypothetical protein [Microvirga tunisiensis]|uniref:Uncharacterized protein n=1 Tax=Microvirga tunisiensis TaxID=2108360 RepID=A0A5N7MS54_9HYPH|nr:hypothetical protein [Microvirga tunisiensis]MPR09232.1 hypothetical protein [Microvirga tunisiensis]MPR29698.1 hypothetical protein [Microvirga tunisiensis]
MRAAVLFLVSCLALASAQAKDFNPQLIKEFGRAYGFLTGQNLSLDKIEREFPTFKSNVIVARLNFSSKYGDIRSKLEDILRSSLKDKFPEFQRNLHEQLKVVTEASLTQADVSRFLQVVQARADGEISDEMLKPMLIAKYEDRPTAEFLDGWRQTYTTDGSGKALGVKLQVQVPRSFGSKESPRPHIVRNWTSENDRGTTTIALQVRDLGAVVTQRDLDAEYGPEFFDGWAGENGKLVDFGKFKHETFPAVWAHTIQEEERATMKFKISSIMYMVIARDKAVALQCMDLIAGEVPSDPKQIFQKTQPLCVQMLNTLVIQSAYSR